MLVRLILTGLILASSWGQWGYDWGDDSGKTFTHTDYVNIPEPFTIHTKGSPYCEEDTFGAWHIQAKVCRAKFTVKYLLEYDGWDVGDKYVKLDPSETKILFVKKQMITIEDDITPHKGLSPGKEFCEGRIRKMVQAKRFTIVKSCDLVEKFYQQPAHFQNMPSIADVEVKNPATVPIARSLPESLDNSDRTPTKPSIEAPTPRSYPTSQAIPAP